MGKETATHNCWGLRCPFLEAWHPALAVELGQPEEELALVFEAKSGSLSPEPWDFSPSSFRSSAEKAGTGERWAPRSLDAV